MAYIWTLIVLIGISVSGTKLETYQCSNNQLQRCLISVTFERKTVDVIISTVDQMRHCRNIREGMNCLVWYSVNCISQSQRVVSKNVIENVRKYLKNVCEDFDQVDENWLDRNCFLSNEIENCKDNYFKQIGDYKHVNEHSCSQYYLFRKCVEQAVDSKCLEKYGLYLISYLIDKADHFSWMCAIEKDKYFNGRNDQLMQRTVKGAQCLINHRDKLSECTRSYHLSDNLIESDDMFASACCAFNKYAFCMRDVVDNSCGSESRELADIALSRLNSELNRKCISYDIDVCSSCSAASSLIILIVGMVLVTEGLKRM